MKIIIEGDFKIEDTELRNHVRKLETKLDEINKRTKIHTIDIRELKKINN